MNAAQAPGNLTGMLTMAAGITVLSTMDVFAKLLVEDGLSAIQVVAMRGWIAVPLMLTALPRRGGWRALRSERMAALVMRGGVGFLAPVLFFTALSSLPLADTTAIFFSTVFIMTALSGLLLRERVGRHRWLAVVVGFTGVLAIARPGADTFQLAALLAAGSSLAYAIMMLWGKHLSSTESTFKLVFYFNLVTTACATVALPFFWVAAQPRQLLYIVVVAVLSLIGHVLLLRAVRMAPISAVAPLEYSALVWAILFGWAVWADVPDTASITGMVIIVASGIYISHRENIVKRLPEPDAV